MDFDDIVKIVDQVKVLEARLAAVEAERDAARAEAEARVKQNETQIRIHFQNTREWKEALKKAQAAEARAVEALRRCHEGAARQLAEPRDHDDDQYALTAIATDCEAALADSANALDWLTQQRREAVAAWIEKEATKCRQQDGEYYERSVEGMLEEAAALRAGGGKL